MEGIRNIYRRVTLAMVTVLFISICVIYIYFTANTSRAYEEHAVESIIDIKKDYLKSIVDNQIAEIEWVEINEKENYKKWIDHVTQTLEEYYQGSPDDYIDSFIGFCKTDVNKESLTVSIRDLELDQVLYESNVSGGAGVLEVETFSSYFKGVYGRYEIFFGVSNDYIQNLTKQTIGDSIRNKEFAQNSYIWVHEIKDYNGGDNYAISLIHPNLIEKEGQFLSTKTKDAAGNYPYAQELEGVKQDGEIFLKYYFKKKDSHVVSEKLTYAKLYKKYDWVIAMGVHLDDIESYIDKATQDKKQMITRIISHSILFMLGIFLIYWVLMSQIEKWYYRRYNNQLKEVFIDPLTKIQNRRSAVQALDTLFKVFQKTGQSPMLMIIDIDDFKQVNDAYGHFEGDAVLKNVVNVIKDNIRETDRLCRWGGEEFLLICKGLKEKDVMSFANKIISLVGSKEYEYGKEKYHATISMGIDSFHAADLTYEEAIKRADAAMYTAKYKGKNRACTGDMCGINPLENQ